MKKIFLLTLLSMFVLTTSSMPDNNCNLNGFTTFTQGGWGNKSNSTPGGIRDQYFSQVFPGGLIVGSGTKTIKLTSAQAIENFLPQGSTPSALTQSYIDPTNSHISIFAGQAVALSMNVSFDLYGAIGSNSTKLGDLVIVSGSFSGKTVNQFLSLVNIALGGGNTGYSLSALNDAATAINENFDNGTVDEGYLTCPNNVQKASIGDKIWNDANKNGIQESGENGICGVTVSLYNCDNNFIASTTTNTYGNYSFSNLTPGSYYVKFNLPANYAFSPKNSGSDVTKDSDADLITGKTDCTNLISGENDLTWDAGMYEVPCINKAVKPILECVIKIDESSYLAYFGYLNENDVAVTIPAGANNKFTPLPQDRGQVSTFQAGRVYKAFSVPFDGSNLVWALKGPDNNIRTVTASNSSKDCQVKIGDFVWNDENKDGLQDNGETGIPNVTVNLFDCGNNLIATTVTNSFGAYLFEKINEGSYYIQFILPQGYAFTSKDVFANGRDEEDSDADLTTGKTGCTSLAEGEINLSFDAGMFQLKASLGDKVWNDVNKDGTQNGNENGIQNVIVSLFDCAGSFVTSTTTDGNGEYIFTNLLPGDYKVKFALPATYVFSPANQGLDDNKDSDADETTGVTSCVTLSGGDNNLSVDAGMYVKEVTLQADLSLTKSCDKLTAKNGDMVTFTITVLNSGPNTATNVSAKDFLTAGFDYSSAIPSQGSYNQTTGLWTIGSLASGNSAILTIACIVNVPSNSAAAIDLGTAKGYNVFVLKDINQPSADTEGKMAVGRDAFLAHYSVGDKLPSSNGIVDALIVGRNLTFMTGSVYGGNVVFGNSSNLPIYPVSYVDGTLRQDSPIDFSAAATYLQNLSAQLSVYPANGTTIIQWGAVHMTGTDPFMNVFAVNGADLSAANNVVIDVPNGSVVLVNVNGQTITWGGGFSVNGTAITNVLYNFFEAASIRIQGINVTGSILAPSADVNFVTGVQNGQMICKSLEGRGQFNNVQFIGNIPSPSILPNVAEVMFADQNDPDSAPGNGVVTEDDYASVFVSIQPEAAPAQTQGWNLVSSLNNSSAILSITSDKNKNLITGTLGGKIYRNTATSSEVINKDMDVKTVWSVNANNEIMILAGTEKGLFASEDNGTTWQLLGLEKKDVRSIVVDAYGTIFAATWGEGLFVSKNGGTSWAQANKGLENLNVQSILLVNNQLIAATYGGGIYRSIDDGTTWMKSAIDFNFIWNLTASPNGNLYAATYGNGVYKSEDNGMNWTKVGKNLKTEFIYSLSVDKNETVYASSLSSGMYSYSKTNGSWQPISLPKEEVSSIYVNTDEAVVYAGTKNGTIYSLTKSTTNVEDKTVIPTEYSLNQNYPNPFNPTTTIQFSVAQKEHVTLVVYNTLGEEVVTLFNEDVNPGNYSIPFNGSALASGMYIYRLSSTNFTMTKKMMLLK